MGRREGEVGRREGEVGRREGEERWVYRRERKVRNVIE